MFLFPNDPLAKVSCNQRSPAELEMVNIVRERSRNDSLIGYCIYL